MRSKSQKRAKKTKGKVKQRWLQAFCKKKKQMSKFWRLPSFDEFGPFSDPKYEPLKAPVNELKTLKFGYFINLVPG